MDEVSYLRFRRDHSQKMAIEAPSDVVRRVHQEFADRYGRLVDQHDAAVVAAINVAALPSITF